MSFQSLRDCFAYAEYSAHYKYLLNEWLLSHSYFLLHFYIISAPLVWVTWSWYRAYYSLIQIIVDDFYARLCGSYHVWGDKQINGQKPTGKFWSLVLLVAFPNVYILKSTVVFPLLDQDFWLLKLSESGFWFFFPICMRKELIVFSLIIFSETTAIILTGQHNK